jgi:hypothetical protein
MALLRPGILAPMRPYLQRMRLDRPQNMRERLLKPVSHPVTWIKTSRLLSVITAFDSGVFMLLDGLRRGLLM